MAATITTEKTCYPGGIAFFYANQEAQDGTFYEHYCQMLKEEFDDVEPIPESEYWEMWEFYRS